MPTPEIVPATARKHVNVPSHAEIVTRLDALEQRIALVVAGQCRTESEMAKLATTLNLMSSALQWSGARQKAHCSLGAELQGHSVLDATAHNIDQVDILHEINRVSFVTKAKDTDDITTNFWNFRHSYWDVAAFLGHRNTFAFAESVANVLLLFSNIIVQALFITIVHNISVSSLDHETIEGYRKWRTTAGHSIQYMDDLTSQSLAALVCTGDSSLHLSDTQSSQVTNINAYLRDHSPFNGPMMCILASLTWSLTVSREFRVIIDMIRACTNIPRGQTVISSEGDCLTLLSLSICRLLYIFALAALRALVAGSLLLVGINFLMVTISIEDMLLNAVALEFIMNVDELFFEALAPIQTRRVISLMRPLQLKQSYIWSGLDTVFVGALGLVVTIFSISLPLWLLPEMEKMREAELELCGGVTDFSYTLTVMNTVQWAMQEKHESPADAWSKLKKKSQYKVIRGVIEGTYPSEVEAAFAPAGLRGQGYTVEGISKWDLEHTGNELNGQCVDADDWGGGLLKPLVLQSLRDSVGDQTISSCKEVWLYCNNYTLSAIRLFCARTCACGIPNSTLALPYPSDGCPAACFKNPSYTSRLNEMPCQELSKNELVKNSFWVSYTDNFLRVVSAWGAHAETWGAYGKIMQQEGCSAVSIVRQTFDIDLCEPLNLKSMAVWCPVSCACAARKSDDVLNQCARTCNARSP